MSHETARPAPLFGLLILALVLVFGVAQLWVWTDRGLWIDEVSQLLNVPLESLGQAFGPLPEAQQAAPPLFNLILHAISGLTIPAMRIVMVALTLGVILLALSGAFARRPLPVAVGLFVLLLQTSFLINATMLKYYAFDIAGFAVFAAWIYGRDRDVAFGLRDVGILSAGMLMGISTIIGAAIVVAVFLTLRLIGRQLGAGEVVLGGLMAALAVGYYLQIGHATEIQITAFPDAYAGLGADAVRKALGAAFQVFQTRGAAVLLLLIAIGLVALIGLHGPARARLARLALFGAALVITFLGLAAIGKYPAVSPRHMVWMLGVFAVLAGAVVDALLMSDPRTRRPLAIGGLILLGFAFAGLGARVAMKWPPQVVDGPSDQMIATLAELPPSRVVNYFGTDRLIPLMLRRGAPIDHHTYAPDLSTRSGRIEASYYDPEWLEIDDDLFGTRVDDLLRSDPLGWAKMYILIRTRGDYRPLARFVLDAAPSDGSPFYITALHVAPWTDQDYFPTAGLRQALDERSCTYEPLATYDTLLSPGFILTARCPGSE